MNRNLSINYSALLALSSISSIIALGFLTWMVTRTIDKHLEEAAEYALWIQQHLDEVDHMDPDAVLLPADAVDRPPADLALIEVDRIAKLQRLIRDTHGITVRVFDPTALTAFGIDANSYPTLSLEQHLQDLHKWLSIYPPILIERSGLQTIYLFKGWEKSGVQTAGFLVDRRSIGMEASQQIFHHEFFHILDINDGGIHNDNGDWLYTKYGNNPPDISASTSLDVIAQGLDRKERPYGYVTAYGKYAGIDEDQGTVAGEFMTRPNTVLQWAKNEAPLAGAITFMKKFFYAHSDGKMDERFWEDLQNDIAFTKEYWRQREDDSIVANQTLREARSIVERITQARALTSIRKIEQAEDVLKNLIAEHPESSATVYELGRIYEEQRQYQKAIDLYEHRLRLYNDPSMNLLLANDFGSLGQSTKAIENYTTAFYKGMLTNLDIQDFQDIYESHAKDLMKQKRFRNAIQAYEAMLRLFGEKRKWQQALNTARRNLQTL